MLGAYPFLDLKSRYFSFPMGQIKFWEMLKTFDKWSRQTGIHVNLSQLLYGFWNQSIDYN